MTFDVYADLANRQKRPSDGTCPAGLVSGFVDSCTGLWPKKSWQGAWIFLTIESQKRD